MNKTTSTSLKMDPDRTALRERAQRALEIEIEFIPSDEFEKMLASKTSLKKFETVSPRRSRATRNLDGRKSLTCLSPALNEPLLSFMEEQHEFRRMNYLKFVAARLQSTLSKSRPSRRKLDEFERSLAEATEARNHIIRTNLRLVVSNAGKYCSSNYGFEDLVSDGSMALMEAVDKFDYQRGFRFSTYATHAIRRSFFRKIERRQKERQRFVATDPDVMTTTPDRFEVDFDAPAENQLISHVVGSLSEHLTERELHIVEGRFGLNGRSEPRTLLELSGELGICKERVRQVEGLALRKLQTVVECYNAGVAKEHMELAPS
jgi:RNA polymerase sigma factor (sigma-70 family)